MRRPQRIALTALVAAAGLAGLVLAVWPRGPDTDAPHATASAVPWSDIPRIDVHTHIDPPSAGRALRIFADHRIVLALNASGGAPGQGGGLETSAEIAAATGGRLLPYCNLSFRGLDDPRYPDFVRATLRACKDQGAVGLKIFKGLGLGAMRADGSLVPVDDPALDVVFETAGELGLPVLLHSGDPQAFFHPATPDNERYDELAAHPGWSFHGDRPDGMGAWPSWEEVYAAFERRVARHPGTTFVGAHFGNAPEDPDRVGRLLDRCPNLVVETGARIPEIGRHDPERMHAFFVRYQDRILFGTDLAVTSHGLTLGSSGAEPDPPERVPFFFAAHWRYFETRDRDFAHPTPIQGRWRIHGIGLGPEVLEKVYWRNAARIFGLTLPTPSIPPEP